MIDSFDFVSWCVEGAAPCAFGDADPAITAFWPYAGPPGDDFLDASAATWILTILGMIFTFLAIVGWFYMDNNMLLRHARRLREAGFGRGAGAAGQAPPGTPGAGPGTDV